MIWLIIFLIIINLIILDYIFYKTYNSLTKLNITDLDEFWEDD